MTTTSAAAAAIDRSDKRKRGDDEEDPYDTDVDMDEHGKRRVKKAVKKKVKLDIPVVDNWNWFLNHLTVMKRLSDVIPTAAWRRVAQQTRVDHEHKDVAELLFYRHAWGLYADDSTDEEALFLEKLIQLQRGNIEFKTQSRVQTAQMTRTRNSDCKQRAINRRNWLLRHPEQIIALRPFDLTYEDFTVYVKVRFEIEEVTNDRNDQYGYGKQQGVTHRVSIRIQNPQKDVVHRSGKACVRDPDTGKVAVYPLTLDEKKNAAVVPYVKDGPLAKGQYPLYAEWREDNERRARGGFSPYENWHALDQEPGVLTFKKLPSDEIEFPLRWNLVSGWWADIDLHDMVSFHYIKKVFDLLAHQQKRNLESNTEILQITREYISEYSKLPYEGRPSCALDCHCQYQRPV